MRARTIFVALAVALAFSAAPAMAQSVSASGSCNGHSDSASADSSGPDGPDDPQNVVDAVTALLTGTPGDCSEQQGHLGASATAAGETVGLCTDGDAIYDGGNDEVDGCTGDPILP